MFSLGSGLHVTQLALGGIAGAGAALSAGLQAALFRNKDAWIRLAIGPLPLGRAQPRRRIQGCSIACAGIAAAAGLLVVPVSTELSQRQEARVSHAQAIADSAVVRIQLLEDYQAPRSLPPEQRALFLERLRQATPAEVEVQAPGDDPEATDFALELARVLAQGGWRIRDSRVLPARYPTTPTGIRLFVPGELIPSSQATALKDALEGAGYPCELFEVDDRHGRPGVLRLIVGSKSLEGQAASARSH